MLSVIVIQVGTGYCTLSLDSAAPVTTGSIFLRGARRLQGGVVKSGSSMFSLLARALALIKGPTSDTLDRRDPESLTMALATC